ncbi:Low iron-inducible periplasmic protein-domain-containing protein [Scenedesmus sp. NREL 46B-D3]|nr:Low iron-inducible periplasmic protein-domain-containing protein [Scenedesmus sp. NREL 46B-D3]
MACNYMKCSVLLLSLVACAVLTAAEVPPDTTGSQIEHAPGFTFGSKVGGYLRLSTDICDIKAAIGPSDNPDYAEAQAIYMDGRNSFKNDGTVRTLRELATASYAGEPTFDLYADYFNTSAFLDQPVNKAFRGEAPYLTVAQRNETIVKGLESTLQTVYLLHELDEGADKIRANRIAAADGAPHNIDETWAIYVGESPTCSLWGASHRRAREFGTMQDCTTSKVNAAMLGAHRALYRAASEGTWRRTWSRWRL